MQTDLLGNYLKESENHVPYVHLGDKKEHFVTFATNTAKKDKNGKFGDEIQLVVKEDHIKKILTLTRPLARELKTVLDHKKILYNELKDHEVMIKRHGKGYSTFYEVNYTQYWGDI